MKRNTTKINSPSISARLAGNDEDSYYDNEYQFYSPNGTLSLHLTQFISSNNTYHNKLSYRVTRSPKEIFDLLYKKFYDAENIKFNFYHESFYIFDGSTFVSVEYDLFTKHLQGDGGMYNIYIHTTFYENLSELKDFLDETLKDCEAYSINWAFMTSSGHTVNKEMRIADINTNAKDEFYPWIKNGIDSYYERYLKSSENVLLLIGMPGTGKTTFIRNLLDRHKLNSTITYDEKLMNNDQFFLDFMLGDKDVLIFEDADTMILDREKDNNTLLAKILNVSDGLIKTINKKIIFSTNLTDRDKIDSALMRPGRCFDVMDFRTLTYEEAKNVLKVMEMEKELDEDKTYTLAEILSNENKRDTKKPFKFGFHA